MQHSTINNKSVQFHFIALQPAATVATAVVEQFQSEKPEKFTITFYYIFNMNFYEIFFICILITEMAF